MNRYATAITFRLSHVLMQHITTRYILMIRDDESLMTIRVASHHACCLQLPAGFAAAKVFFAFRHLDGHDGRTRRALASFLPAALMLHTFSPSAPGARKIR